MKRLLLALLLVALPICAQDWAKANLEKSPRHREWATVTHHGRSLKVLVAYPESSGKTPVVLMIHEIFGMTDWVQDMADQIAAMGYIVVAPDLLSGMGTNGGDSQSFDQSGAIKAVSSLDPEQVKADLIAAADYGLSLPASKHQLFVMGFCWGGGQAFRFATERKHLGAAFVFYGPPPPTDAMKSIDAPVYGFYGGNDERIDATIPATKDAMQAAGKTYDPTVFPGAGHGFMRAGEAPDATRPNAEARTGSLARVRTLLAQYSK